ncbi:meiotic coiled-coil protein 2 [Podospora australis]|uniref:Meiotic coiled-coil protein 2 n=1 Tax=Podospora australis TaxID=1536484 RepID=A0AAN6WXK6_9PEZI|nr:meiotic coiled-coil protein 2 [Podospora australis]
MMSATAPTGSPSERRAHVTKSFSQDENTRKSEEIPAQASQFLFPLTISSPAILHSAVSVPSSFELSGKPGDMMLIGSKSAYLAITLTGSSQEVSPAIISLNKSVGPLSTSKFANQSNPKMKHEPPSTGDSYPMDKLYAKLSEQHVLMQKKQFFKSEDDDTLFTRGLDHQSSCSSLPITPATDTLPGHTAPTARSASATPNETQAGTEELLRLKIELAQAQNKISLLEAQSRFGAQDSGRATPVLPGLEADFSSSIAGAVSPPTSRGPTTLPYNAMGKVPFVRESSWMVSDDARSDIADTLPPAGISRTRGIWNNNINAKPAYPSQFPQSLVMTDGAQPTAWTNTRTVTSAYEPSFPAAGMDVYRQDRLPPDHEMMRPMGRRTNRYDGRFGPSTNFNGGFNGYNMNSSPYEAPPSSYPSGPQSTMAGGGIGVGVYAPYQQQPVGTPLSPHATEFTSTGAPWKTESLAGESQTYVSATTEPLNYRRLLDRNVTCDWKYIVDKIVCNNDQQASIFLQQKLKVGTPEQKYDIVEAIVAQAYPLMINRFGNFLVQRCFEHGTPEQVIKIAEAIRGNTLNLSMDPFGCHVVQKAFDSVPEDYKAVMVHELLRRIPETVIHRYACHVWQKLFELRWTESPPQIMKYVNEALRGMWHEVALGETGSLVVQNIFENCLEEDKRPCIEEVLANIDIVAHGQFGNWCIQHICEHGAPADRSRAIDHVIRYAAEYSMDQFASKVVEKCLKIGGPDFLGRYLDRVCEGRVDRPRIPLIDIASDQYGNYLIQYILTHANPQHREIVAAHIRKHMVSLRGSKFGSRVGMLCTNHAVATRPGPGVGPAPIANIRGGPRYGGGYR